MSTLKKIIAVKKVSQAFKPGTTLLENLEGLLLRFGHPQKKEFTQEDLRRRWNIHGGDTYVLQEARLKSTYYDKKLDSENEYFWFQLALINVEGYDLTDSNISSAIEKFIDSEESDAKAIKYWANVALMNMKGWNMARVLAKVIGSKKLEKNEIIDYVNKGINKLGKKENSITDSMGGSDILEAALGDGKGLSAKDIVSFSKLVVIELSGIGGPDSMFDRFNSRFDLEKYVRWEKVTGKELLDFCKMAADAKVDVLGAEFAILTIKKSDWKTIADPIKKVIPMLNLTSTKLVKVLKALFNSKKLDGEETKYYCTMAVNKLPRPILGKTIQAAIRSGKLSEDDIERFKLYSRRRAIA